MDQQISSLEKMSKAIKKGNRLRLLGIVTLVACGVAGVTIQTQNTRKIEERLSDLNEKVTDLNSVTEDMAGNVYDIMEQGCPGNTIKGANYQMYNSAPQIWISGSDKTVTYIYPEEDNTETHISLTFHQSEMWYMWPQGEQTDQTYNWDMVADKDGTLYDQSGNEYSYIFWEASDYGAQISDEGFCVKGSDTAEFLRETLREIGLTPKEYNEFIVYWLPQMQDNEYNIIHFDGLDPKDIYNQNYELQVTDGKGNQPESVLRLMMAWKASEEYVEMNPQEFTAFERNGFTVVEWGGLEMR